MRMRGGWHRRVGTMSDVPRGQGWWQAADGKWYPPQPVPPPGPPPGAPQGHLPPGPRPGPPPSPYGYGPPGYGPPPGPPHQKRPGWLIPLLICGGLFLFVLAVGAIGSAGNKKQNVD